MTNGSPSVGSMILIPGLFTLAVTLLRLIGELRQWNSTFFGRAAGGGGAVVGISWLAVVFAVYFAVKVKRAGQPMESRVKAIILNVVAIALFVGGTFTIFKESGGLQSTGLLVLGLALITAGIVVMRFAWSAYWTVMMGYAFVARIPVIIVMYLAMRGNWGTHYDAVPPKEVFPTFAVKFAELALVPQIFFWIPYTVILCGLIGIIVAAIGKAPAKIEV